MEISISAILSATSFIITGLLAVVGYFLRQKDELLERQIQLLFAKHDSDAEELAKFKLQLASTTYSKHELDARFDKLIDTIREMGKDLGSKVDSLQSSLMTHMVDHIKAGDSQ